MSKQDAEISEWLTSMGAAQYFNAQDIESGRTVTSILLAVDKECKIQLQEGSSAIVRVSNWNAIVQYLKKIEIKLTQQQKSKIINGNHDLVFKIISKLKEIYQRSAKQTEINLKTIDFKKQIKDSESLLQLFLLAIIKHFSLSPKESLSLLSNQAKYLAHLLAKGLKGDFKPIENLISQLARNISKIVLFCKNKQNEIFFLKSIKPALISKSESVAQNTINLVNSFLMNYSVEDRFQLMRQYLIPTFMLVIRRHSQLADQILKVSLELVEFNQNIISNLYENTSKNDLSILFVSLFKIYQKEEKIDQFINCPSFKKMIDHITDGFRDPDQAVVSLGCCLQLASSDFSVFQKFCGDKLIQSIQQIIFSKECHNVEYLHILFALLSITGSQKHQLAPLIYKLIAARIANAGEVQYEILIHGLNQIYNQLPSIPVSPILDAITQRSELRVGQLQILIFSKILSIGTETRAAVNIYNIVSRSFVQEVGFGKQLAKLLIEIVGVFKQQEILMDMTGKLIKVSLALYFANFKKLAEKRKPLSYKNKLDSDQALTKLKMIEIEYFLRKAIEFGDKDLLANIEPLICFSYLQIVPLSKEQAKGLESIISLMGDANKLVAKYQKELETDIPQNKSRSKYIEANSHEEQRNKTQDGSNLARSLEKQRKQRVLSSHPLHPMSLSMVGVKQDAFLGLQKYAKRHQIKALAQQSKRYQAIQAQQDKNKMKKLYEKKMVLQKALKFKGVNQGQLNYLFQFESKEVYAQTNHLYLNNYSAQAQEDRDAQGVEQYMRRYEKTLRVYYSIYSGKKHGFQVRSFDQFQQKNNLMHTSHIVKLLKDHGIESLISANQIRAIARRVNYRSNNAKDDPETLDFDGFKEFVLQMAFTMYTRPPKDLRGRPVPEMLDQLFSTLKLYASENKISTQLFEQPQACFVGEQQAVKLLNQRLQQNSDYILPQGYKKITETRINLDHRIYLQAMSPTYKEVIEVIDEILFTKFKFHIIQPFTTEKKVCWARPNVYTLQKNKLTEIQTKHLPVHLKKEVAKFPIMERATAKEAALVLADIVRAVELNHDEIGLKHQNPLIKSKKQKEEELKRLKEAAQEKRKYVDRQLKTSMDAYKTTKQSKQEKQQQQKRQLQQKRRQEKQRKQKRTKQLKQKLQVFNEKKKQDEQAKKANQQARIEKQKAEGERKKRQQQQTKRKIEELKKQKQAQQKQKKQRQQQEQKSRKEQQKRRMEKAQRQKKQKIEEYKQKKKKGDVSKVMDAPANQQYQQNEQNP